MIKVLPRNIFRFIVLILVQILIFNNIELGGYLNPYIYVLFIILLPFETPNWMLLVSGFALGLTMDIFSETLGMHTSASVLAAYVRPMALSMFAPRDGYESGSFPRVHYYGFVWFLQYSLVLVFAHHMLLFLTEMFRAQDIMHILARIILSSIFSVSLICLSQYFVFRK